ncbi:MAG: molybdopterin-guanine dinucleotide biosynthesis protein B [Rhodospirillales bacterium]|nr:molybdopterin-guanine dinucleotide biosynthesis protein B [Rhodospirillales bacterium]MBO6785586.1 molybdopterin-guanine dinucleotide biosynthesis protein B [Rhodospirillales bacterium]
MKIFGFAGWSGSGKTTLVKRVIPELIERGLKISTIKHTHHNFDIDRPGKDSFEHRAAGAHEVVITGAQRWALLHENRGEQEPSIEEMLEHMSPVDLVLIEGFKSYPHPKMEVYRPEVGKPLLCADDPSIVAVATPGELDVNVPRIDLDNVPAVVDFVVDFCELPAERRHGAA